MGVPSVGASGAIFGTLAVSRAAFHGWLVADSVTGHMGRSLRALENSLQTGKKGMPLVARVNEPRIDIV